MEIQTLLMLFQVAWAFAWPAMSRLFDRWAECLGAQRRDRFVRSLFRLVFHTVGLWLAWDDWNGRTFVECATMEPTFHQELVHLPTVTWLLFGILVETRQKLDMKGDHSTGEGWDLDLHHWLTIFLVSFSWLIGNSCYSDVILRICAVTEPFIDLYRLGMSFPLPASIILPLEIGTVVTFPWTRGWMILECMIVMVKLVPPFDSINNLIFHLIGWPIYALQAWWSFFFVKKTVERVLELTFSAWANQRLKNS